MIAIFNYHAGPTLMNRIYALLIKSDPTPTKFTLCVAAIITAVGFYVDTGHCSYAACAWLNAIMPWYWWAALWTAYAVVKLWRIFDTTYRPHVALVINAVGVVIYSGAAVGAMVARWPNVYLSAFGITLALASIWVFARTAVNPHEIDFRCD